MKFLHIKNYRTLKESKFNFGKLNLFIGDNNTGKTSLMKLLDTLFNNKRIDFANTYLFNYTFPDISFNNKEPVEILIVDTDTIRKSNKENEYFSIVEYYKIFSATTLNKIVISEFAYIDQDNKKNSSLNKFIINYKIDQENHTLFVQSIQFDKYNLEKEFLEIANEDKLEYLKKVTTKQSNFNYTFKLDYDNLTNSFKESIETIINISHSDRKNNKPELSTIWKQQILFLFTMQDFTKHQIYILRALSKWEIIEKKGVSGHGLYNNLLLAFKKTNSSRQNIKYDYENIVTDYVEPIRNTFKRFYTNDQLSDLNSTDSKSLTKLKSSQELHSKVEKFLKSTDMLSSFKIKPSSIDNNIVYIPKYKKSNSSKEYKLFISGTGISQILPILTSLYDNQLNKVFMEQPEIHLHPKLQSLVGKSIFEWFIEHKDDKTLKNQLFIETHSKYLIDHIRYQIYKSNEDLILKKEKEIETISTKINLFKESKDKEKITIFYFNKNNDDTVSINNIDIQKNGKLNGEIDNYTEFFIDEALKIMEI